MNLKPFFTVLFLLVCGHTVFSQETDSFVIKDLNTISVYQTILISTDKNIMIPNVGKDSPYYYNTLFLKSLCEFKKGSYWTGYWDLKKVYNHSSQNFAKHPEDTLSGLLTGIISTSIGIIPQEYKWIMRFIGFPELTYENHETLIENAKKSTNPFIQFEAFSSELFLDVYIKKEYDKEKIDLYEKKYGKLYQGKIVLSWVYDRIKEYKLNINILNSFTKEEKKHYDYYNYLLGTAHFYLNHYKSASLSFNNYLKATDSDYIKTTKYRLFLIDWLSTELSEEEINIKLKDIIKSGDEKLYLDKYAQSFALSSSLPDKKLMYARMLYDGKEYNASDSVLMQINPKDFSRKDKLEYNYRYARVKEALNDTTLAIKYYLNVIDYGGTKPKRYFTANAALQLGILYEGLNDKEKAIFYYKKAYSYPKHSYKNSIDAEAKRRLKTL
ncbi:tetratricopeptide repeat protein [Flammeovirga aprica]|uniref:Tetratricopeptide repeat protein n=1 Tax=Flammeovirga aprica JL-4 TaxID=694437 RepID=A0A7X9P065_9BACT|nr:tetratricopeptide repeat protein [Flammeovirga aprica]NME67103.1 tetratricopeptide repeat protein [Flammeovirga aprica JL-4]